MLRIYKSSAGSGKTYTLVKEFLRIALKEPEKYKHILAITFTNKAANEMKERIIESLRQIRNGDEKAKPLLQQLAKETELEEKEVTGKSGEILRHLLHNYSDLSVSTIDSFVHRIIRSFAFDLHLPMNFEIEMDADKLLTDTIELLMDRISDADNEVTNAIVEFAESNVEEGKGWNLEHSLIKLGRELFKEETYRHLEELKQYNIQDLKKVRESLYKFKTSFEQKLFHEGKDAIELIHNNALDASKFFQTTKGIYGFFFKYYREQIPDNPTGNSYVQKSVNGEKWYGGKADDNDKAVIDSIANELTNHYRNIISLFEGQGKDYHLACLIAKDFFSFTLLTEINALMTEFKKENNILHISEFQEKINAIVREQDAPVIYERIGEWFDNILIDEFQDTSVLQWQNLVPLVENAQMNLGDNLIVGDGKQAIYRFRGGEVTQFAMLPKVYGSENDVRLKEREIAIGNYDAELFNLELNWRSRNEIISFNNQFYDVLKQATELSNNTIYDGHEQKPGKNIEGGYVSIEFLPEGDEEKSSNDFRCERVEGIIHDAVNKGYSYRDIAVLTRSNVNASKIASYLLGNGIRVVSPESLLIHQSPKVKLILATLNYLDQKENHISRAEMIYYLHLLNSKEQLHFAEIDFKVSEENFEKIISDYAGKSFNSYDFQSKQLLDLVSELLIFWGLQGNDPFIQFFSDEVMTFLTRNRSNIREFLDWWGEVKNSKSIIYPNTLDAVRLMTIHKSKGLQFPVVIMADADWNFKNSKNHFWVDVNKPYLNHLRLVLLPVTERVSETEFAELYDQERDSSFLDMLNLVYVATTRPEDTLYILSSESKSLPKENNSVQALLIHFLEQTNTWDGFRKYEYGDAGTQKIKGEKSELALYKAGDVNADESRSKKISIRKKPELLWKADVKGKIDWGNLVHETLKQTRYSGDEEAVTGKMLNSGAVNSNEYVKLIEEVRSVINHEKLKNFFTREFEVITERAFLSKDSDAKIPDRVVMDKTKKSAVIIDFKTGKRKSEHRTQINEYGLELMKFGFGTVKKLLVYSEERTVEEI